MISKRTLIALVCGAMLSIGVAACGSDSSSTSSSASSSGSGDTGSLSGEIAGAGSSAQQAAMEAWVAGVQKTSPDVQISYDPVGSGAGREQFIAKGVQYAGSDSSLDPKEETPDAEKACAPGKVLQVPVYISPIALIYNLQGVDKLQLTPDTIAGIFAQKITTWNDPAIAKDNPGVDLPDTDITPVNRSDDSGTTANFTDYMSKAAPDSWTYPPDDTWPVKGGESAEGTSGVVEAVNSGDGTIGYADASQAGDLSIATVQVGSKFVAPSADGAAAIVDTGKDVDSDPNIFNLELDRTTSDPSMYPITLASYEIACTQYDDATQGGIVKALLEYEVSSEGQQAAAKAAGSAPLSSALAKKVQPIVDSIKAGS